MFDARVVHRALGGMFAAVSLFALGSPRLVLDVFLQARRLITTQTLRLPRDPLARTSNSMTSILEPSSFSSSSFAASQHSLRPMLVEPLHLQGFR